MGAIAAGADPEPWTELGARIGEAFQVADDLHDVLHGEDELGKPCGQDAAHGRPNAVADLGVSGAMRRLRGHPRRRDRLDPGLSRAKPRCARSCASRPRG